MKILYQLSNISVVEHNLRTNYVRQQSFYSIHPNIYIGCVCICVCVIVWEYVFFFFSYDHNIPRNDYKESLVDNTKFLYSSKCKDSKYEKPFCLSVGLSPSLILSLYIYIYHHHHHIVLAAGITLTLSRHSSLSFIALGRSSGQQPVSSLMSSSLLLQQCPACLVRLT